MRKHFRSNGRQFFYKEGIEKSALDERKFLAQIFQKISGVEFWKEKSCHWKTSLFNFLSQIIGQYLKWINNIKFNFLNNESSTPFKQF